MCPGANGQVGRLDVPPRIVHQVRQVQQQFVGSGIEPQSFAVDRLLAAPAATQGDHHRLGGIAIGVMRVQDAGMAQRVFGAQAKRFRLLRHGIHGKGVRQRQAAPGLCGIRRDPGHMLEHAGGLCGRFRAASPDGQLGLLQRPDGATGRTPRLRPRPPPLRRHRPEASAGLACRPGAGVRLVVPHRPASTGNRRGQSSRSRRMRHYPLPTGGVGGRWRG